MTAQLDQYAVGDALEDAVNEFRLSLLGGGHVSIGVHNITRDCFDQVSGDEQHFPAKEKACEFWSKSGFNWSSDDHDGRDRHAVRVSYFTNEAPVVVSMRAPQGFAADADPPYGDTRGPDEVHA